MCLHELWTYTECGCQIDHLTPCLTALGPNQSSTNPIKPTNPTSLWRRCRRKTSLRGIRSPSPLRVIKSKRMLAANHNVGSVRLPPSPDATDEDFEGDQDGKDWGRRSGEVKDWEMEGNVERGRECSVNHTVRKVFLEPICDDCLLREMGVESNSGWDRRTRREGHDGGGLVWGSDVKIEVSPEEVDATKSGGESGRSSFDGDVILESNVEIVVEEPDEGIGVPVHEVPAQLHTTAQTSHIRQPSAFSATDADDEGSIEESIRGRDRVRSTRGARTGFDIVRNLGNSEDEQVFPRAITRSEIVQKESRAQSPTKSLISRFREVETGGKKWMKGVVGDLKRSLSRTSRTRRGKAEKGDAPHGTGLGGRQNSRSQDANTRNRTLRAVVDEEVSKKSVAVINGDAMIAAEEEVCPAMDVPFTRMTFDSTSSSWQAHLSHDLALPVRVRKPEDAKKTRTNFISNDSTTASAVSGWFTKADLSASLPLRNPSLSRLQRRLLSTSSTTASFPVTASSTWSESRSGRRLASLIQDFDSEFDASNHQTWGITGGQTIKNGGTDNALATRDIFYPQRLPDTAHSSPSLTNHPLSTPLRIITPTRPAFTPRSSSLQSPPLSNPIRLNGLEADKALSYSRTENFACVWERKICGRGCGKVVGERAKSCICESEFREIEKSGGRGCMSQRPVVRYVEGELCDKCAEEE